MVESSHEGAGPPASPGGRLAVRFGQACLVIMIPAALVLALVWTSADLPGGRLRLGPPSPGYETVAYVRLDEPGDPPVDPAPTPAPDSPLLRVAMAPLMAPETTLVHYHAFAGVLASRLGRRLSFLSPRTYADTRELLRSDRCDLASLCTYAYLLGQRESTLEALVIPRIRGRLVHTSLLLVSPKSSFRSLLDLKGKSFAIADTQSGSAWLHPSVWLLDHGEDPEQFFSRHLITGGHDSSIRALTSGLVDGTSVSRLVFDDVVKNEPAIKDSVKVLYTFAPYSNPPFVVSGRIEASLKSALIAALLSMHEDPVAKPLLAAMGIDRFEVPSPQIFNSLKRVADRWEARK